MSGSRQTTTSTEKRDPWSPAQPHLKSILEGAGQNYAARQNQQFYPGQTYAGFSPETEYGLSAMYQRAQAGSPLTRGAQGMIGDTLSGSYLNAGNPGFRGVADRVTGEVLPAITAQWQRAGRGTGNGAVIEAASRGIGDALAPIAHQDYRAERAAQMQAAGMAPSLAQADYADMERALGVGQAREAMTQRGIDEAMQRYAFDQNRGADALREYSGFVSPIAGLGSEGTSTQTQQSRPSGLQTALGVGLMGASLFGGGGPLAGLIGGTQTAAGLASAAPFRMGFASPYVRA